MIFLDVMTENEKRAAEEIYNRYKKLLFSTAAKYAMHTEATEDIVQEVVLSIIKYISVLEKLDDKRLASYLFVMARNAAYSHRRKEEKETCHYIEESLVPLKDFFDIESYVIAKEQLKTVKDTIDNMGEREQMVLYGRFFLELSFDELADIMGCKPGSVRMMLTRAKRELAERLRKEGAYNG